MEASEDNVVETEEEVTVLELFFDLVFVFAITQVTGFVTTDPSAIRLVEAVALLTMLWSAWTAYAWLGNTAGSDEGAIRVALLAAMVAMLIVSLAVPHAFGDDALIFGLAYFVVRALHLGAYKILARDDATLRAAVARLGMATLPVAALLVLAGLLDGTPRTVCWIAALAVNYGQIRLSTAGWRIVPGHLAERHGLTIIVALGESVIALGVGAEHERLSAGVIAGAALGMAVAAALWWAYVDVDAIAAERRLRDAGPEEQIRLARDAYTFGHLPMIAGIVFFAVGVEETLADVGAPLHAIAAVTLCGGVALYLVALSAFRWRSVGSFNRGRLVVAALLAALTPLAATLPALLSLAFVAVAACGLIAFEFTRFAEERDRVRHAA
jgi:low temperature requirement protein LtrA